MKKTVMFHLLVLLLCTACVSNRPQNETGGAQESHSIKSELVYALTIETNVDDPVIIIENLGHDYYEGIKVPEGDYHVEVIKDGYISKRKKVLVKDMDVVVTINLARRVLTGGKYALIVTSNPSDARIRIMNIKPKYHHGIQLTAGRYLVEVTRQGYIKHEKWITINGEDRILNIKLLKKKSVQQSVLRPATVSRRLLVKCRPEVADIKILNSSEKYRDNMHLKKGKYLVEVSMKGYETRQKWAVLEDKDCVLNVTLEKE